MLIIGSSEPVKKNALLNLRKEQDDIDKIYFIQKIQVNPIMNI